MKVFISQRKSESKSIKLKNMHILFGFVKKFYWQQVLDR